MRTAAYTVLWQSQQSIAAEQVDPDVVVVDTGAHQYDLGGFDHGRRTSDVVVVHGPVDTVSRSRRGSWSSSLSGEEVDRE